jgi:hypothetical protein
MLELRITFRVALLMPGAGYFKWSSIKIKILIALFLQEDCHAYCRGRVVVEFLNCVLALM